MLSLTIGSFGSKLLTFFFVPFYTAVLSTEEYGTADLITTTVSLLFPFFSFIMCEALLRFAQEKNENKEQIYSVGMVTWIFGFCVMLLLSPLLLFVPTLKPFYWLVILYYFTFSFNSNIGYYVRGIGKVSVYSISGIINTFVTILLNLLFLLVLKTGVVGYLLSFIIANFVATVFMIVAAKTYKYRIHVKSLDKSLLRRMLSYSVPLIPNSASWWISNSSDKYILTFFSGVAVNGIYSIAYKIPTIITMVTNIFTTAWRLSAVEKFGTEESKEFYSNVFNLYVTLTVSLASWLMLINKPLSHFLYSKEFYQAWQFVPVLLIASVVHSYSDFFGTIYTSVYKTKMIFYSTLVGAGANVVLNFLLIPKFSALGAAIATMLSYFVVFVIRFIDSRKILKLNYDIKGDFLCVVIIVLQLIISSTNLPFELYVSCVLFLIIIVIRKSSIKAIVKMMLFRKSVNNIKEDKTLDCVDLTNGKTVYSGYVKNNSILRKSASGGAAAALYNHVLKNSGVVYGVGYTEDFKSAEFYEVTNVKDISILQSSKYIQSKKTVCINGRQINVFDRVAEQLQNGKNILFIGLGCDVAALLKVCESKKVDTSLLYTIDIICHGPTLPEVETSYIEALEKKYHSRVKEFSVRYKKDGWVPPYIRAIFENGKEHIQNWYESDFNYAFGHYSRPSCWNCKYKGNNHTADITIGDYWGMTPDMDGYNEYGVSVFIVHSNKGETLLHDLPNEEYHLQLADASHVICNNPMYYKSRTKDTNHDIFKKNLESKGLQYAVAKDMGVAKYIYWKVNLFFKGKRR